MLASRVRGEPALVGVSLYTTHRCNLRCIYCSSPFRGTDELATEQWLSIVDELADLGCQRVGILGGEPLLRRDTPEIIDRVRDRGMSCVLTQQASCLLTQLMSSLLTQQMSCLQTQQMFRLQTQK